MRKKKKLRQLQMLVVLFLIISIGVAGYEFYSINQLNKYNEQLITDLNNNTQTVYVATTQIKKGDKIVDAGTSANVELQTIRTGLESYNYITADEVGNIAIVDIEPGIPIMNSMTIANEVSKDDRSYEIAVASLMTDQETDDYVDVRIAFADGTDYIVLSKKKVDNLNLENCIFNTTLNEEEIVRFQSAIIDAYTLKGCTIYTTRYVESNLQDEAIANYPVRSASIDLINSDPNVLTKAVDTLNLAARISLEERLGQVAEEDKTAIQEGNDAISGIRQSVVGTAENVTDTSTDGAVATDNATDESTTDTATE